jgi:ribosomal protein S18 acetylase RimI-like enzyme
MSPNEVLMPSSSFSSVSLSFYDHHLRIQIEYPGVHKETFPGLVRFTRPAPGMNFVSYSRLDKAKLDFTIQEQVNYFMPLGQPFEWLVYQHDQPENLKERLLEHGFADDEDPDAVMVLDLQQYKPVPVGQTDIRIRKLAHRDQLADVISVENQVLGGDFSWIKKRLGDHMELDGYVSVYVIYVHEKPVSTGWIYFHPNNPFATLNGGATIREFRQHGLYTALVNTRLREAQERGYHFISTDASPFSRPILEQNSFYLLTVGYSMRWSG